MPPIPLVPQTEKPPSRHPMLVPGLVLAASFAASMLITRFVPRPASLIETTLFHQTGAGWERVRQPADPPDEVHISPAGMVWSSAQRGSGMSRLEGPKWRRFSRADFGTRSGYLKGRFVLDGESVWAASSEGVLRWDGQRWHCYREAVASKYAYSIVAAAGHVWVIDYWGSLSEFDGTRWTIRKLDLPGVNWKEDRGPWPQLARTSDGALWLVRDGVWRFDGSRWTALRCPGSSLVDAWFVGVTGDRVWLRDDSTLRSVSADGRMWAAYKMETTVNDVASAPGHIWLATGGGILEWAGPGWRRVAFSGNDRSIRSLDVGPDGRLWAVGVAQGMAFYLWLARCLPLLVGLATLFWMARIRSRQKRVEDERVRQAVQLATGEVPEQLRHVQQFGVAASNPWKAILVFAGTFIAAIVAYEVVRHWWRREPWWMVVVFVVAIHLVVTFLQSLVRRKPLPSDPIGPGGQSRYDWGKTWKALGAGVVFLVLFNIPHVSGYFYLALIVLPLAYQLLDVRLTIRSVNRTDYDGALRSVRLFHFFSPQGGVTLRQSGIILLLAGRYREAEDALRRSLAGLSAGPDQAVALDYLGETLMELGRNEEAQRSFEASLHAAPGFRRPYRGMAEIVLRQGRSPQQALEYVEQVRGGRGFSWTGRLNRKTEDDYWALKAWALAEVGRSGEVALAIEAAFKATNKKSRTEMAATSYRCGMAMQATGNQSAANEYFKRAQELDPHGRRGTLAKAALHTHSVWGD